MRRWILCIIIMLTAIITACDHKNPSNATSTQKKEVQKKDTKVTDIGILGIKMGSSKTDVLKILSDHHFTIDTSVGNQVDVNGEIKFENFIFSNFNIDTYGGSVTNMYIEAWLPKSRPNSLSYANEIFDALVAKYKKIAPDNFYEPEGKEKKFISRMCMRYACFKDDNCHMNITLDDDAENLDSKKCYDVCVYYMTPSAWEIALSN